MPHSQKIIYPAQGENLVRGYAPKGKRLEIRLVAKNNHISMISSVTNEGKTRFMMYQGAMNATLRRKSDHSFLFEGIINNNERQGAKHDGINECHEKAVDIPFV